MLDLILDNWEVICGVAFTILSFIAGRGLGKRKGRAEEAERAEQAPRP